MARILIIEDDPDMRSLLSEVIGDVGHEVFVAADGEEGLRALEKEAPDVLITDIVMPEKDGLEVLLALRSKKPRFKIIAISGTPAQWMVLRTAEDLGAHKTLAKPFTRNEIVDLIDDVLATA
jgi:CheY-like chemotaxis protein